MTNPTTHGQVPEALIDLIDAYAETRHRCGGIYNARTEAARKAVIEALSGVQALSAAPAIGDELRDTLVAVSAAIAERDDRAAQKMICEILAASTTPPAEQQATKETSGGFHVWRDIATAPKDGSRFVAIGYNYGLYSEGRHICVAQWFRGCWMETSDWNEASELQHLTHWLPLPSPPDDVAAPAEQQAPRCSYCDGTGDVHGIDGEWRGICTECDAGTALRQQAAPKAAPTRTALPEGWTDCTIEFGNDGPEVVAYGPKRMMTRLAKWLGKYFAQVIAEAATKAAPGEQNTVPAEWLEQAYREGWAACRDAETIGEEAEDWAFGNSTANSRMIDAQQAAPKQEAQGVGNSGFDHKTAADFLSGKTISDEAVRKFVQASRWAHDEKASLSAMLISVRGELASREAEIALLKKALLEAEAAPQQEAQEPHGWLYEWTHSSATGKPDSTYTAFTTDEAHARKHDNCRAIYTAPQPAPAPLSDDVVKDAARYRWLREGNDAKHGAAWHVAVNLYGCEWDAAIDAALAAQRGNK